MLSLYPNEDISSVPCSNCGGAVIEFSIPNDIWNKVIRPDGHEHANEYLCMGCFFEALRKALGIMEVNMKRDWSGFKWENNGGMSEVLCQSNESGMWTFIHWVNGVGVAGGSVGASYLEAMEAYALSNASKADQDAPNR